LAAAAAQFFLPLSLSQFRACDSTRSLRAWGTQSKYWIAGLLLLLLDAHNDRAGTWKKTHSIDHAFMRSTPSSAIAIIMEMRCGIKRAAVKFIAEK
jgi:hypothetical protein